MKKNEEIEINFKPTLIQNKVLPYLFDNETTEILFGGAVRVSKSYLICAYTTIMCLAYPHIHAAICRARLSTMKKTTIETLLEFFRHQNIEEDKHFNYNRSDGIITFNNGSKIFFLELYKNPSDPDYNRIMSLSLTIACVDEVSEIEDKAIYALETRLSHMLKEYNLSPKLLLASNPNRGWLYKDYYKPFIENRLPDYRKVVLGLPEDNPYVDKGFTENLEKVLDEGTLQRLRYGNWDYDDDDFTLFSYDDIMNSFYGDFNSIIKTKFLTCDVANVGNDKTCITIWEGYNNIDILLFEKKDTQDVVRLIKEKMRVYDIQIKNVVIDGDGLGIGVADYLKGCKVFKANTAAKNKENYDNFKTQCYYKLRDMLRNGDIKLNDKYKEEIVQELQAHKIIPDNDGKTRLKKKDDVRKQIGRSPDISDSLMMRMLFEYKKGKVYVY